LTSTVVVAEARGQFGNPEEGERLPLEAATRQRLVKTLQAEKTYVFALVNCKVCELVNRFHDPAALFPRIRPPVTTEGEAGWAPEPVW
jgi:hypothetical protein